MLRGIETQTACRLVKPPVITYNLAEGSLTFEQRPITTCVIAHLDIAHQTVQNEVWDVRALQCIAVIIVRLPGSDKYPCLAALNSLAIAFIPLPEYNLLVDQREWCEQTGSS